MDSVTIEFVPAPGLSKNNLRSTHWRTLSNLSKAARDEAFFLGLQAKPKGWKVPDRADVDICQYHAKVPLDFDGLACAAAPYLDGLVDSDILRDDSPDAIASYNLKHTKVSKVAESRVSITVTPVGR